MKNRPLLVTAIIGLTITASLHVFNTFVLDVGFVESINNWVGVYCAWVGLLIGSVWSVGKKNHCGN